MLKFFLFHLVAFILLFSGCASKIVVKQHISKANLKPLNWEQISNFKQDNLDLALDVFKKDCKARRLNKHLQKVCKIAKNSTDGKEFFQKYFIPYRLLDSQNNEQGLITGYYEPILNGSFTKSDIYKYPIYKTPKDLIVVKLNSVYPSLKKYRLRGRIVGNSLVPYKSRKEINKDDSNLEPLLYVDNKIDRFFLEIQGSGKIKLENGKIINVAYAQQNGRIYYPIGRKLIQDKQIKKEDMSLQAIRKWCENNPSKVDELLNQNDSVVFFKLSNKPATGSLGIPLVAKRNIAIDKNYIPLGFPIFVNTTDPITSMPLDTLVIAADTGGAIKGQIRADFFWGNGIQAKSKAGKMAQKGTLTILIPKEF